MDVHGEGLAPQEQQCHPPRRFVVEIAPTADGRVVGTVGDGDGVVMFSGWMDLLRLLEPVETPVPHVAELRRRPADLGLGRDLEGT